MAEIAKQVGIENIRGIGSVTAVSIGHIKTKTKQTQKPNKS